MSVVELKNPEETMFIRLEHGAIYNNEDIFVAFWKKSKDADWNKQGNMPIEKLDDQIKHLESQGFVKV